MSINETNRASGFKGGQNWNGNAKGRPKKVYSRDDFTNELFLESKDDIREIKNKIFAHAKNGDVWAMKLVWEYFLTKPKVKEEEEADHNKAVVEGLTAISIEKLKRVQDILREE